MVINEARRLLANHSAKLTKAVESGEVGPEQIGRVVLFRIGSYIARAAPDRLTAVLVRRSIEGRAGAPVTHSELLGFKLSNLLTTTIGRLDPEEQRGVLFYVAGDSRQHGIAVVALQLIGESSAVEVTTRLIGWRSQYLEGLEKQDLMVRAKVDSLPKPIRRLAMSSIDEAALCLSAGDQRSAMSWLGQVRQLVGRYGKETPTPPARPPEGKQLPALARKGR